MAVNHGREARKANQMKRDEVLKSYEVRDGRVVSPGKFEGQPVFAPHFWQIGLEGFADADDGQTYVFKFTNGCDDFREWPELKKWLGRKRSLRLVENAQGFVSCR